MSQPAQPILVNSTEQQLTESNEPKKPAIPPVIIFVIVYGIVLYSVAGYFFIKTKFNKPPIADTTTVAELPTPTMAPIPISEGSASAINRESFTSLNSPLRVPFTLITILPTGNSTQATPSSSVVEIPIAISTVLLQQIMAYKYETFTILGPKNWHADGLRGEYGINIHLYPIKPYVYPSSAVWFFRADPGSILTLMESAKYFSSIREQWSEYKTNKPVPLPQEELVITPITRHLLRFSSPLKGDLEMISVVFSDAEDHKSDKLWNLIKLSIMVPQSQHQFAMDILNLFIQQFELDKK
ncbi:MAG: hypothetical protein UU25_C0005G0006 [Microgenomates group bacterium GW2011_GWB1_40_9]|nr:MAG: hypothetical protein UU25_C0005G0006 [Microgenomates group bacterium GW2011_GWB1_40_9]